MKRINIITGFLSLIIIAISTSCSESFLDTEAKGVQTTDNFYKTDNEARQGVLAAYARLASMNGAFQSMWALKTLPGDEVAAGGGTRGDQSYLEEVNEFNYDGSSTHVNSVFNNLYQGVNRCNIVTENVEPDTEAKTVVIAESKFLRALFYFDLVTMWGEVPLVTTELEPSEYQQTPAATEAIWTQIETDLTDAISVLPVRSELSSEEQYRATKGAAQALLGKSYLYQQKYDLAADAFDDVISSGEYTLVSDYSRVLRVENEFSSESLFEVTYDNEGGIANWGGTPWKNNIMWQFCSPRDGYFSNLENIGMFTGWGGAYPITPMWDAYEAEGDEIRRKSSMISETEFVEEGVTVHDDPYAYDGYIRLKYTNLIEESGEPNLTLNNGTNLRLIRYADVLLMAAEANILKTSPDFDIARGYIDEVRNRVELEDALESDADLMDRVITERRLELSFEGCRFPDLIRWNNAGIISDSELAEILDAPMDDIEYRKPFDSHFKLYPVPDQEILTNPNMSQNDGY